MNVCKWRHPVLCPLTKKQNELKQITEPQVQHKNSIEACYKETPSTGIKICQNCNLFVYLFVKFIYLWTLFATPLISSNNYIKNKRQLTARSKLICSTQLQL